MSIEARHTEGAAKLGEHRAGAGAAPSRGVIVLVDTDPQIAAGLSEQAAQIGISTLWCRDGADALLHIGAEPPDVLVLAAHTDIINAAQITAAVRGRWQLPILIGAAPATDLIARKALAAGASAVITRPYDINAISPFVLGSEEQPGSGPAVYIAGPIQVDRRGHETRVRGRDVQLTVRELELLVFLIEQHGRVASSEEISRAVWGRPSDTNTVAVHVRRLREKLGDDPEHGEYIRTIRGAGYRLAPSIST
ncbi:response regulator transcription factor [Mycobacteroides abscessus subsp. abscessus]|uniref:Two-component system response regulator n=1 Tax=Mycobacteroides chelonae TaxID=1774 RepID=A0A1S1LYJ9_MYCCH|nr:MULTISPECIES: response regulator transcription factor [Mycobacteroides]PKQ57544.1 two-component system response regulator [Mycobacterium sp. MHSD3]SKL33872.1 Putative response regulator [Mycobacteroides abscessus subsp. bolletii]AYM44323.1 DNA-binding response regulator [[Mycobacterium] chelonae subsp. gwanakae]MBF9523952.1 response regulator transcription factor [Mycobacteroides chelonae]MDO3087833.1 response regulator transcription factor [Mycobacteroides abscessus subsp. abscessus]